MTSDFSQIKMYYPQTKGQRLQLSHNSYDEHTHPYLRQVSTSPVDEVTEFENELGTTEESFGDTTGDVTALHEVLESTTPIVTTQITTSMKSITLGESGSSDESSQTIFIVLGLLLGILVLVCCVLACILAKLRRKGFCTVQGRNQETCDDECAQEEMDLGQSPKNSVASVKHMNSRSSDQLLKK